MFFPFLNEIGNKPSGGGGGGGGGARSNDSHLWMPTEASPADGVRYLNVPSCCIQN